MNNPILKFYFQPSFSGWMVTRIFECVYEHYSNIYGDLVIKDNSMSYISNGCHKNGAHNLIIENQYTKKYKVVSYWDRVYEILEDTLSGYNLGWNNKDCMGVYSTVDSNVNLKITPTSYCVYNVEMEDIISKLNKNIEKKNTLLFRGYLHSERFFLNNHIHSVNNNILKILEEKLSYQDYINELNSYLVGISLNGAAEICNRDIEILGVGSALFRPKLIKSNFYDPLVPDIHYIPFDLSSSPIEQIKIIVDKYYSFINNVDYIQFIANNGNQWYNKNGSLQGNVLAIIKTLNIEELL